MTKLGLSCVLVLLLFVGNSRADDEEAHLLVHVIKDSNEFRVLSTTLVGSGMPRQRDQNRTSPWRISVVGSEGQVLHQAGLADPTVIRGEFRNPSDPEKIDAVRIRRDGAVHFSVRLPMVSATRADIQALAPTGTGKHAYTRLGSFDYPLVGPQRFQTYDVEVLQETGDPGNRVDIVILGDGYRVEDQAKLTSDILAFLDSFWAFNSIDEYHNFFNIKLIHVISNENGADNGSYGAIRDTALGAYYGCYGIDRLICVDEATVFSVANSHAPEYDNLFVIVNDPKYGGAGGFIAVFSANEWAGEVSVHEYGHSMGGLADEYEDPYPGYPECPDDCPEPNATTRTIREQVKWNIWILPETPVPTPETATYQDVVGVFEGARYQYSGVYRPRMDCIMRYFGTGFCEVCSEGMVLSFYNIVSGLDEATPQSSIWLSGCEEVELSATYPIPDPDTMMFTWKLDGQELEVTSEPRYLLKSARLGDGTFDVSVEITDTTPLVRNDPFGLLTSGYSWSVTVTDTGAGACMIDDDCYLDGELNPENACQICLIANDPIGWSDDDLKPCDDGDHCTEQDQCSAGECSGTPIEACYIDGDCHLDGSVNPDNFCQVCLIASDPAGWSDDDSKPCDDLDPCTDQDECADGACAGTPIQGCCVSDQECDDGLDCTVDECNLDNLTCTNDTRTTYCVIAGGCYQNGEENPEDSCQFCNSAESQTEWTKKDNCPGCSCSPDAAPAGPGGWLILLLVFMLIRRYGH